MNKVMIKVVIICLMLSVCLFIGNKEMVINYREVIIDDVFVQVKINNEVKEILLNDYLLGVVVGEMPASFEIEALKAQVVASRTYVYSRDLVVDDSTSTQVYLDPSQQKERLGQQYDEYIVKITKAIKETEGEVLVQDDVFISSLFFSSSGGYTQNNEDYFVGTPVSYLRSVESSGEEFINPNYYQTYTFSLEALEDIFLISGNFNITAYNDNGSVSKVYIGNTEYSGRDIREKLGLASNYFTMDKTNEGYTFTTSGSGHGVGMSQYGAQNMALQGLDYIKIIEHYYSGVEIKKM